MKEYKRPSDVAVAWFAGLFDGEGSVQIQQEKRKQGRTIYGLRVDITSTYLPTLEQVRSIWHLGSIQQRQGTKKPAWSWRALANDALFILEVALPFLVTKQAEARLGISYQRWKRKDISVWGYHKRPAISYEKERQCKELLESHKSSKLEKEIDEILHNSQLPFCESEK